MLDTFIFTFSCFRSEEQIMDEDIHICGSCKGQFTNLDEFILHKRQCKARMEQVTKAISGNLSTTVPNQETMRKIHHLKVCHRT